MIAKEKAKELINKMHNYFEDNDAISYHTAQQCALIAVDEILESIHYSEYPIDIDYWNQVKQEIENL